MGDTVELEIEETVSPGKETEPEEAEAEADLDLMCGTFDPNWLMNVCRCAACTSFLRGRLSDPECDGIWDIDWAAGAYDATKFWAFNQLFSSEAAAIILWSGTDPWGARE